MTQCVTPFSGSRAHQSIRIIATCKLTLDQLKHYLMYQDSAAEPLENQGAWGTGRNDLVLRGVVTSADHQRWPLCRTESKAQKSGHQQ